MNKKHSGFTLLELIMVVIIIGILAAIAIPRYTNVREREIGRSTKTTILLLHAALRIKVLTDGDIYTGTDAGFKDVATINSDLRTSITETCFGEVGTGTAGFYMELDTTAADPANYRQRIYTDRLSGPYAGDGAGSNRIACDYYYNTVTYDWSSTTWPLDLGP